ncbi:hypothetical protein [Paraburkholderia sp.]|uniref:hypothetical protein n=1 Tax=Paraburkholderia sp. TaxID=1926495 RepID=UPI0039C9D903
MTRAVLSLGSNLGDREAHLRAAVAGKAGSDLHQQSKGSVFLPQSKLLPQRGQRALFMPVAGTAEAVMARTPFEAMGWRQEDDATARAWVLRRAFHARLCLPILPRFAAPRMRSARVAQVPREAREARRFPRRFPCCTAPVLYNPACFDRFAAALFVRGSSSASFVCFSSKSPPPCPSPSTFRRSPPP